MYKNYTAATIVLFFLHEFLDLIQIIAIKNLQRKRKTAKVVRFMFDIFTYLPLSHVNKEVIFLNSLSHSVLFL